MNKEENSRISLFERRKLDFLSLKNTHQKKYNFLSTTRILLFIAGIIALVYFSNERNFGLVLLLIFVLPVIFGFFINYHNKIRFQLNQASFLADINKAEIDRINLSLLSFNQGDEYQDYKHPYTSDLNFFGRHSLFQLINRTVTPAGKNLLATTLKHPLSSLYKIKEKQVAIQELAGKLEWRQQFEARGKHEHPNNASYNYLLKWIKEPSELKNKILYRILSIILPVAVILSLVGFFYLGYSGYFILTSLLINALVLFSISKLVTESVEKTDKTSSLLKTYSSLISAIEDEDFSSPYLINLKKKVASHKKKASERIQELSKIVGNLELRKNPYFSTTINIAAVWDLQWLIKLESWKEGLKDEVEEWVDSVEEFEVLNSLAGFAYSDPALIFPAIKESLFYIEGTSINHPLISKSKRVDNGIKLEGLGKTHVITGSNMSGKSTYMRTIGINAALAMIGAPVLANSFTVSPLKIFTCMHIHDSLEEETSSFYAELKRIRQLILELQHSDPVLYLLDELLKGTNSVDRNIGAKALIKQLHCKTASGLISTHDLELGEMEQELPESVKNYSFNSSIINNEIIFDYKLKEGICHSFNASKLMEKMGIEIN